MASDCGALLASELNKLTKSVLIDIIVSKKLPNSVTSDVLVNFFNNSRGSFPESVEAEKFRDAIGVTSGGCTNVLCVAGSKELHYRMKEVDNLKRLTFHLEKRTEEQHDLVSVLKAEIRRLKDDVDLFGKATPSNSNASASSTVDGASSSGELNKTILHVKKTADNISSRDNVAVTGTKYTDVTKHGKTRAQSDTGGDRLGVLQKSRGVRRPPNFKVGTGSSTKLKQADRHAFLHVYNLHPSTEEKDIIENLSLICDKVVCEKLNAKHPDLYSSFKLTVPFERLEEVSDPDNWPCNVRISRFFLGRK